MKVPFKHLPFFESDLTKRRRWPLVILVLIPISVALWVWLSALAFVPVPWPDDSAFYFVAKELFRWPPRWVMLPQAPFEPTYRIFNFNTMPLYPILIGLGRWIGIDGSFLLKIWPLSAWALSGSLLVGVLYRQGFPWKGCALIALAFALDPESRWASVLVRPESLIGLIGMALILGLTFGFPEKYGPRKLWDPVALLLALGAFSHFNAVHLVPAVLLAFAFKPRRLFEIATKTALYLSPWILAVLFHWELFIKQMNTQWGRLNVPNFWLSSVNNAISSLFQALGSPEPWPPMIRWASICLWVLMMSSIFMEVFLFVILNGVQCKKWKSLLGSSFSKLSLKPSIGWVLGSMWLWNSKPEVWFVYYIHISLWCLVALTCLKIWRSDSLFPSIRYSLLGGFGFLTTAAVLIFASIDLGQAHRLGTTASWNWPTYYDFVGCVDQRLSQLETELGKEKPFRVWCPTFPDITIELSRKHPNWELTRTNDFSDRANLAIQHGWDVEAVVVTETLNWHEASISQPAYEVPQVLSVWMLWKDYFLNRLWTNPSWKPSRFICQRGRWQAFLFMKNSLSNN